MNIEQGILNYEVSIPSTFNILSSIFNIFFLFNGGILLIYGINSAFQRLDI
jgi:hypothetical protein